MENPFSLENGNKKRWTVEEKVQIVRRYLKDHVGLADLAEETGSTPGLILGWAKQALEGLAQTFSREMHQQRKVLHREIQEKDDRIRKLESVVSELSTENLLLKKSTGDRDPRCAGDGERGHKDRDSPFGTGRIPHQKVSFRSGSPGSTYHRWVSLSGKKTRPEGVLPKGHRILPEEREKILAFKRQHPTVGGVRLASMMLDQGVAAVSPATVFRIIKEAGLSSKWTRPEGRKASRQGFYTKRNCNYYH